MGYLLKVHVAYYLRMVKPEKYKALILVLHVLW